MKTQSIFTNFTKLNKKMLEEIVKQGDTVVDATLGNGNDALYLAKLVGTEGKVFGFDIQKKAVAKSCERMATEGISNYIFFNKSHEEIDTYVQEARAVSFNLGYLPGSSRGITTKSKSTLLGVKKALKIIKKPGMISIMFYTGHKGGAEERDTVLSFVEGLSKKDYDVLKIKHINGKETAPFLLIIYKKGE